jgi:hypothetical protein
MFEEGRITGLLDFEHAHVGDPMMDLAALRVRDTIKSIGELSEMATRYRLDPVAVPESRPSRHAPAFRHLVGGLRDATSTVTESSYEVGALGRVANHLKRVDEIGAALDAADLDDLARVLGYRPEPAGAIPGTA